MPNAKPYNYSDMTGIVALSGTAPQGTWTAVYDSGSAGTPWGKVSWHSHEPTGTLITVRARSSEMTTTLGNAMYVTVANGIPINNLPHGRYLQV